MNQQASMIRHLNNKHRNENVTVQQLESRTHGSRPWPRPRTQKKIRGQGQGQGQTLSRPRTGMLEAKAKDQGTQPQVFSEKKIFKKVFQATSNS